MLVIKTLSSAQHAVSEEDETGTLCHRRHMLSCLADVGRYTRWTSTSRCTEDILKYKTNSTVTVIHDSFNIHLCHVCNRIDEFDMWAIQKMLSPVHNVFTSSNFHLQYNTNVSESSTQN